MGAGAKSWVRLQCHSCLDAYQGSVILHWSGRHNCPTVSRRVGAAFTNMSSSGWGNQLGAAVPLIDQIGTRNVNALLLCMYAGFWSWGVATLLLIPVHANEPWPLALALGFVLLTGFVHFGFMGAGVILVPDYVYYPSKPVWLYAASDAVILTCWITILVTYILNPSGSSGPIFTTFFLILALSVNVYKLFLLVRPWDCTTKEKPQEGGIPEVVLSGESVYEEYEYDEYEYEASAGAGANPGARKLAALLKQQRAHKLHGTGGRGKK